MIFLHYLQNLIISGRAVPENGGVSCGQLDGKPGSPPRSYTIPLGVHLFSLDKCTACNTGLIPLAAYEIVPLTQMEIHNRRTAEHKTSSE